VGETTERVIGSCRKKKGKGSRNDVRGYGKNKLANKKGAGERIKPRRVKFAAGKTMSILGTNARCSNAIYKRAKRQ